MAHKVFVYGTLKQGHGNHHLLGSARLIGRGLLKGMGLYDLGYFPCIVPEGTEVVTGELYGDVSDDVLASLDRLEGYREGQNDNFYEREDYAKIHLTPDVAVDNVIVYYMNSPPSGAKKIDGGIWQ